jgi:Transglycosylase SLT domain
MRVDSALQDVAIQAVSRAAQATGVDFGMLLETAKRESGLDRNAKAATSSAAGLFQFIESTWMGLIERHGGKYGLSPASDGASRKRLLDLRYDPELAANMAGELTRENSAALASRLGRQPSPGELYAAHVLGADGAARLIEAPGQARAADLFPKAAAANRALFFDKAGAPVSAAALLAELNVEPTAPPVQAPAASPGLLAGPSIGLLTTLGESFGFDLWSLAMKAYRQDKP